MRNRQIAKGLQSSTLHHKAKFAYPSTVLGTSEGQRKDLEESCERRMARRGGRSGWLASNSCNSVARTQLTVNKYYLLHIIRMISGLEVRDSRGDRHRRSDASIRPSQNRTATSFRFCLGLESLPPKGRLSRFAKTLLVHYPS